MSERFVNIVIDKEKDSKFLVSDEQKVNTADLSSDRHTSIAKINIKDKVTTVCRYEDGEDKGQISLNIGLEQLKINSDTREIVYLNNDIRDLARLYSIDLQEGQIITEDDARSLCKILAKIMISTIYQNNYSWGFSRMIVNGMGFFENEFIPKIIIFSGISSKYVFDKNYDIFMDGNIGMLLYQEINNYEL